MDRTQGGDREFGRLLEEQAALRRVATLVARGTDRLGVFSAVAEEVGRLFGADVTSVIRFDDGHGTIVGGWSGEPMPAVPIGFRASMERDSTATRVHRTGRVDIDDLHGDGFAALRELGLRASVGASVVVHGELWGAAVGATKDASFPPGAEQRMAALRNSSRRRWPTPRHAKSSPPRVSGSSRRRNSSAAGSSATSTTAPNSAW